MSVRNSGNPFDSSFVGMMDENLFLSYSMIRIKKSFVKQILPAPTPMGSSLSSFNIKRLLKPGTTMFIPSSIENQKKGILTFQYLIDKLYLLGCMLEVQH
jgi:hypothetical protein